MLNEKNNEELAILFQRGREEEVFNELFFRNRGLIKSMAKQYVEGMEYEDKEAELNMEFYKAVQDYNGKGKFSTLFVNYAKNRFNNLRVYVDREKNKAEKDKVYMDIDDLGLTFIDGYGDVEFEHYLRQLGLTENQLDVCILIMEGKTKSDIANKLDISVAGVSYRLNVVKEKIKLSCIYT